MTAPEIEKLKALALAATPGPWEYFPKAKYNEHHVSLPVEGSGMRHALFDTGCDTHRPEADARFIAASNPATVLELIAEVERLRADADVPSGMNQDDDREIDRIAQRSANEILSCWAASRPALRAAIVREIKAAIMTDRASSAAPAAGTEKDADRLLAAIVRSDVGIATRHKLEDGQGTATEDGKNWLAAIEFVAAAHTKARDA
jgi:hypothetical protein